MLRNVFAKGLLCFSAKVVAHAPQGKGPILSGVADTGTTEIDNTRQHPVVRQEIRQASVAMSETRQGRQRRERPQFGQNVGCSAAEILRIEVALVDDSASHAKFGVV